MRPKIFRLLLIGFGAMVTVSGIVNLAAAILLLGPSEAHQLGINLTVVRAASVVVAMCGAGLAYMGFRMKK